MPDAKTSNVTPPHSAGASHPGRGVFLLELAFAAFITHIPYLGIPFKWLESFFHELSHALATLVTGGIVSHIQLFPNGAGLCFSGGGMPVVIGFSGYAGAALWGLTLFMMATWPKGIRPAFALLGVMVLVVLLFYARDVLTMGILLVLAGLFFLPLKLASAPWLVMLLRLIALIVLLNALNSPTYLWGLEGQGDAVLLSNLIWIPPALWIALWLALAAGCLWLCWRRVNALINCNKI
ncbi:M50 family metallopeptidase [Shewanella litorisediminis]|uniref:M50 family metallopeptidase n=1 Tax=Shewanella litorisediminis TaxID=1173586 RepID=A0ABX7FYV9_9GAMM|nr:M50 family metallopeptidase [Shewanella litorisediminis]MCL2918805.1 M50 family metallopeptidase [Shewanella litorisediminis]QRH00226.1 M50 family metallopeptidase [Shewanella litorisediminis]